MGANLDRLMKSYGVSTPTVSGYSGVAAPAALAADATPEQQGANAAGLARYKADQDAYDRYVGDYKNRIATTDLYSSPYLNILPKSEQKYQTGNTITTPDYSAIASPVTDINNIRTTPDYDSLVKAAYAGVGRSGIGSEGKNIDQAGYDYWSNQLKNNAISPADFNSTFSSSAKDYVAKNPNDPITTVMRNYRPANAENPMYDALIKSAYSGIGRSGVGSNMGNIDQAGYNYWMNQLNTGAVNPANFTSAFSSGAKSYIDQNPDTDTSKYMRGYLGLNAAQTAQDAKTVKNLTNTTDPYSVGVVQNAGYRDPNTPDSTLSHGGKVKHFYGGGVNRTDGGINDLADKYALDNPAELPVIYAQNETNTTTDAAPPVKAPVNDSVSPPSGTVPMSDARLQDLQASAVRNGVPPMTRGPVPPMGEGDGGGAETIAVKPVSPATMTLEQLYRQYNTPRPRSPELVAAEQKVAEKNKSLIDLLKEQAEKSGDNAPSKSEMYFRLAAALASPTKTGGIMENLALAAKELADFQKSTTDAKKSAAAAKLQLLLKTGEIDAQTAKDELANLKEEHKEGETTARALATKQYEAELKKNEAQSATAKELVDRGLQPGTPAFQAEMNRLNKIKEDKETQDIESKKAEAERKAKNEQILSPADVKLKSGLDNELNTYNEALIQIENAIKHSKIAFTGSAKDKLTMWGLKNKFGEADPRVTATEAMLSALGSTTLQNAASMKGSLSDKDLSFLKTISGADMTSTEARDEVLSNARNKLLRAIKRTKEEYDLVSSGKYGQKSKETE